jgi:hypothetical protein
MDEKKRIVKYRQYIKSTCVDEKKIITFINRHNWTCVDEKNRITNWSFNKKSALN